VGRDSNAQDSDLDFNLIGIQGTYLTKYNPACGKMIIHSRDYQEGLGLRRIWEN
jgi:hypothetical protein